MGFKVASRVRGLSDEAFREAFGAEEQCCSALSRLRWPDGFVCPACGHRGHCVLAGRSLYQCNRCKKQTSSTAGTIFHATKLPLTLWFAAVHLIVTAKNGISSVELGRRLGVKQPTAWTMKHKIMAVMARREADTPLSGRVEMDDAYLGGARAGGKRGRGAPGKTPFVAAVSTSPEGRPRKVKLVPVKGFRKREIARGARRWLAPGSEVLTDGLRCWNALDGVVGSHRAIRTGSGAGRPHGAPAGSARQHGAILQMASSNTTLGNAASRARSPEPTASSAPIMPNERDTSDQAELSRRFGVNRRTWRYNPALPAQHHDSRASIHTRATHEPNPSYHRALIAGLTFMDKQELQMRAVVLPTTAGPAAALLTTAKENQLDIGGLATFALTEACPVQVGRKPIRTRAGPARPAAGNAGGPQEAFALLPKAGQPKNHLVSRSTSPSSPASVALALPQPCSPDLLK